ncbi:hypothetical protein A4G23_05060 [Streptomyces rubrolavendulae]|uniref:Uncharacterized protein n=1 Tax=Streptomyces rubrolavendulae TaxID=285473 RepID=A0A1D8G9P1_9ACTN|nr:hypothetical protein A4G23_05060 [Streptomyces rubrolavendulae]
MREAGVREAGVPASRGSRTRKADVRSGRATGRAAGGDPARTEARPQTYDETAATTLTIPDGYRAAAVEGSSWSTPTASPTR